MFQDAHWTALLEKFDAFRISFNQKWETHKDSLANGEPEAIKYLYNEILDAWESMENTQKEIDEFVKQH